MDNALPNAGLISLAYMAITVLVAFYLARKTERFWFSFVLLLWLLGQPVLDAYYVIELGFFDLQPNRLLLLFLCAALPYVYSKKIGYSAPVAGERSSPSYEIYLAILVGLIIVAMAVNWNALPPKKLVAIPLEPITLLLLYHFVKRIVTPKFLNAVLTAIIVMAIGNALIAFAQVIDPLFLRTGPLRIAFGNLWRAYGAFSSEYILGAFQIVGLFTLITHVKKNSLKMIFVPLIIGSVVLTFHRLDLIILLICGVLYFSKFASKQVSLAGNFVLVIILLAAVPAYTVLTGGQSQLVDERLTEDTITGRIQQFKLAVTLLPKHPLGFGSESHPEYQEAMISAGHFMGMIDARGRYQKVGLVVHNGYLGVGIKYGIVAMIVFTLIIWKMGRYFYTHSRKTEPITIIPFIAVLVWGLSNLTNGIIEFRTYNVMIVALIAGLFSGAYGKGLLGSGNKLIRESDTDL